MECFPLTYDLNAFKSRINRHQTPFNCRFFLNRFLVCFNLFVFLFLVSTWPVERGHFLQSIYEWIEFYILIKTSSGNFLRLSSSWVQMRGISIDQNHIKVCRCWPPCSKIVHGSTHIGENLVLIAVQEICCFIEIIAFKRKRFHFLSSNACPSALKSTSFSSLGFRPITFAFTKMEFSGIESRLYIFLRGLNIGASLLHDLLQVLIQKLRSLPCRSTAIRYGRSPWYIKKSLLNFAK